MLSQYCTSLLLLVLHFYNELLINHHYLLENSINGSTCKCLSPLQSLIEYVPIIFEKANFN